MNKVCMTEVDVYQNDNYNVSVMYKSMLAHWLMYIKNNTMMFLICIKGCWHIDILYPIYGVHSFLRGRIDTK